MSSKPFKFEWEYKDYAVRTTHDYNGEPYVEIVRWATDRNGRKNCYTIAYWHKGEDGRDLRFVGDRMLELSKLHIGSIWPQLCAAQIMLQAWYEDQDGDDA